MLVVLAMIISGLAGFGGAGVGVGVGVGFGVGVGAGTGAGGADDVVEGTGEGLAAADVAGVAVPAHPSIASVSISNRATARTENGARPVFVLWLGLNSRIFPP